MNMSNTVSRILICALLLIFAALSVFPIADRASAPENYADFSGSIDTKTQTVLKLMATATVTSAGISAIPGDTATPIANKLADFSEYFLLILCVLYAEKYLLGIIPLAVFRIVLPLSFLAFAVGRFWNPQLMDRHGRKLLIISAALLIAIPLSLKTSDLIYDTYRQSIDSTIASAEALNDKTEELAEAEKTGLLDAFLNRISETAGSLTDKASETLNRFVESLAVIIVTSCVIPILVLLFFLWLIKQLTGVDAMPLLPRREKREPRDRGSETHGV